MMMGDPSTYARTMFDIEKQRYREEHLRKKTDPAGMIILSYICLIHTLQTLHLSFYLKVVFDNIYIYISCELNCVDSCLKRCG